MRDAIGGVVNIQMILVFIAVVSGYLAFSVSYTKAVHVKDFIINKIEEYERTPENGTKAYQDITDYMHNVGYNGVPKQNVDAEERCNAFSTASDNNIVVDSSASDSSKFVICKIPGGNDISDEVDGSPATRSYYGVVTYISVDIPVVNTVLAEFPFFTVSGKTRLIRDK